MLSFPTHPLPERVNYAEALIIRTTIDKLLRRFSRPAVKRPDEDDLIVVLESRFDEEGVKYRLLIDSLAVSPYGRVLNGTLYVMYETRMRTYANGFCLLGDTPCAGFYEAFYYPSTSRGDFEAAAERFALESAT